MTKKKRCFSMDTIFLALKGENKIIISILTHLFMEQRVFTWYKNKLIEGSSKKVNSIIIFKQNNVILRVSYCLNLMVVSIIYILFIWMIIFVINWFHWHQKLQHLFRGALYNKWKCKKRAVPLGKEDGSWRRKHFVLVHFIVYWFNL